MQIQGKCLFAYLCVNCHNPIKLSEPNPGCISDPTSLLSLSIWTFLLSYKVHLPPEELAGHQQEETGEREEEEVFQAAQGVDQRGAAERERDYGGRYFFRLEDRPL